MISVANCHQSNQKIIQVVRNLIAHFHNPSSHTARGSILAALTHN